MRFLKIFLVVVPLFSAVTQLPAVPSCNLQPRVCMNFLSGYTPARASASCGTYSGVYSSEDCPLLGKVGTCVNTMGSDQIMTVFYSAVGDTAAARVMCIATGGQFAP